MADMYQQKSGKLKRNMDTIFNPKKFAHFGGKYTNGGKSRHHIDLKGKAKQRALESFNSKKEAKQRKDQ